MEQPWHYAHLASLPFPAGHGNYRAFLLMCIYLAAACLHALALVLKMDAHLVSVSGCLGGAGGAAWVGRWALPWQNGAGPGSRCVWCLHLGDVWDGRGAPGASRWSLEGMSTPLP